MSFVLSALSLSLKSTSHDDTKNAPLPPSPLPLARPLKRNLHLLVLVTTISMKAMTIHFSRLLPPHYTNSHSSTNGVFSTTAVRTYSLLRAV